MLQYYESVYVVGTLWAQLLLQFWTDPFETLQVFLSWSEDMHVLFTESFSFFFFFFFFFFTFFHIFNLDFFAWFWVCSGDIVSVTPPTVLYRSLWNFTGILIMVWRYACGFYRILMLFFFQNFHIFNLDFFFSCFNIMKVYM